MLKKLVSYVLDKHKLPVYTFLLVKVLNEVQLNFKHTVTTTYPDSDTMLSI